MIRSFHNIYLLSFLLAFSIACSDEQPDHGAGNGPVSPQFSAGIRTRASDTEWDALDRIGICMLQRTTSGVIDDNVNRIYQTDNDGSGLFSPATVQETIYFPEDGSEVLFKAYYPYNSAVGNDLLIPVDVSDQSSLPAIDLMTAEHLAGFSKNSPEVSLHFHHRLTKLTCMLDPDPEFMDENASLSAITLTIDEITTTAVYDLANEELTDKAAPAAIAIPFAPGEDAWKAIVLPQESMKDLSVTVTFPNGMSFTAALDSEEPLLAGYHYKLVFQLVENKLKIKVEKVEWVDGDDYNDAVILRTTDVRNSGVVDGDTLRVYQKLISNDNKFRHITTFTYLESYDEWLSHPVIFWSQMASYEEGLFHAYTIQKEAYNDTQLPEILVSEDKTVTKGAAIELEMKRAVAKLVFTLKCSEEDENGVKVIDMAVLNKMDITLHGFTTGGCMDVEEGIFIPGTGAETIKVERMDGEDGLKNSIAIIQPQTIPPGASAILSYTEDGTLTSYKAVFDAIEFNAGEATHITIDVNTTAIVMGVKIVDWQVGGEAELDASMQITGQLDGTDTFFQNKEIQVYEVTDAEGGYVRVNGTFKYERENDESAWKWNGPTFYWEQTQGMKAKLTAVHYPDNSKPDMSRRKSFPWNMMSNQSAGYGLYDLVWSKPQTYSMEVVNLKFEHAMSRVVVEIVKGNDITDEDLKDMSVNIMNVCIEGSVDVVEGLITPNANRSTVIPWQETPDGYTYSCLVYPQTISKDDLFILINLDPAGNTIPLLQGTLNNNLTLVAGKEHVITVTVNKTEMELSASLKEWGTGNEGEVTIQ